MRVALIIVLLIVAGFVIIELVMRRKAQTARTNKRRRLSSTPHTTKIQQAPTIQQSRRVRNPDGYFKIEPDPAIGSQNITRVGVMVETRDDLEIAEDLEQGILIARSKLLHDLEDWAAVVVETEDGQCRIAGGFGTDEFGLTSYDQFKGLDKAFSRKPKRNT